MAPAIVVTGVGKTFRRYHTNRPSTIQELVAKGLRGMRTVERFWGLRDINFSVEAGRTVGIIGSNGSGKSTLLRLIGGVGQPDEGSIQVNGRIGALLDLSAGFHPDLTGRENAMLAGILNGLTRKQVHQRLDSILDFAEVEAAIDNPIRTYSSGMQLRLAFAVAVHTEPEILLIDEVLAVGDVSFQRKCLDRIAQFKAAGCSILLVSHVDRMVERLCDEVVWLDNGVLKAQGPTGEVVHQYSRHMADTAARPPAESDGTSGVAAIAPPLTIRTPRGNQVPVDTAESRSLEIRGVRTLDATGQPVSDVESGQALDIEIDYRARQPVTAPVFCAHIRRDDGTSLYFMHTESQLPLGTIEGTGRVTLHLERVDLNDGHCLIAVACYAHGWTHAFDFHPSACRFTVRAGGPDGTLLVTPYRWTIRPALDADD